MTRWRWLFIAVGWVSTAAGLWAEMPRVAQPLESFKVAGGGDHLLLPIGIWGQQQLFVLDTGCSLTAFDLPARSSLGSAIGAAEIATAHRTVLPGKVYPAPMMTLGKITLWPVTSVVCCELALRTVTATNAQACLGMSSIRSFIVQIDFDRGRVNFYAAGTRDPTWGDPIPLNFSDTGRPTVKLTAGGITRPFVIDTGDPCTSIDDSLVQSLRHGCYLHCLGKFSHLDAVGESKQWAGYVLERIAIGRFLHSDVRVDGGPSNKIGLEYLARYRVTFDFPGRTLYLTPGARFLESDRATDNLSGMKVVKVDGQVRVKSIDASCRWRDPDSLRVSGPPATITQERKKNEPWRALMGLRARF